MLVVPCMVIVRRGNRESTVNSAKVRVKRLAPKPFVAGRRCSTSFLAFA